MSTDLCTQGPVKTYFWMVHYDLSPAAQSPADGLTPIPAGRRKTIIVIHRNLYGSHVVNFHMPREGEAAPDASNFRGAPVLRNRIIGFYASAEEANAHLTAKLWRELQEKAGAVYAELHSMKLDVAEASTTPLQLVA